MNKQVVSVALEKAPGIILWLLKWLDKARLLDFLAPLALRLYLVPVLWMAGSKKFVNFTSTADWFGNSEWGLGLPMPYLLVFLVALIEILGALFLLFGFGVRLISIPLMMVMLVAGIIVHLQNGWLAIATGSGIFATDRTVGAIERLDMAKTILKDYGNYQWLTENGEFVVLNNGIEFAATYFIMLLVLFFLGGGRYVSVDYWLAKKYSGV
ncbi:DoxX family protein [Methylomarinum sp. Ch1-1]|uniref:DoxX family protein n=1 Tax=Methylomarinum roseum TaxID=3067653 RepID=A0AAU7NV80_9GAMM|nr:DoxX family protein [Methylomarinum sp. Ch1-1]MDP4519015.1 DoxX family protein [Methylomarinum sp. Ch1-1]